MFHLDLPKLRVCAFERAPRVSGAVGNLVTDNVERGHRRKPVFRLLFIMVFCCNGHHKHTLKARTVGRGVRVVGLCAPARFGADSIATRSLSGGNVFAFFATCGLAPSASRLSTDAWETGVGILNGMASAALEAYTGSQ